VAQQMMIVVL